MYGSDKQWSISITWKRSYYKIKTKTLKQLKFPKVNKLIDNKSYYYLKPTDLLASRFYGQPKIQKPGAPICPIVSTVSLHCKILTNT